MSDEKSFSVCQEMLPLFRAILKFCSTNRLLDYIILVRQLKFPKSNIEIAFSSLLRSLLFENVSLSTNLPTSSMRILEFYNIFGFQQMIETGTRETLLSSTLLDHIATTTKSNMVASGVYEANISDRYLVYCVRKFHGASRKQHTSGVAQGEG